MSTPKRDARAVRVLENITVNLGSFSVTIHGGQYLLVDRYDESQDTYWLVLDDKVETTDEDAGSAVAYPVIEVLAEDVQVMEVNRS